MITESRFAIMISAIALVATGFQAWYAHEANTFNKENITIEAFSSDASNTRVGPATCWEKNIVTITLNWRVTIFNNSMQPVTIRELKSIATSLSGPSAFTSFSATEPTNRDFPVLIEAKNFKMFQIPLPTRASPEFTKWFEENGGCTGKPIWPSAAARKIFDETGWMQYGGSGAMFTAVSGGEKEFFIQAVWR